MAKRKSSKGNKTPKKPKINDLMEVEQEHVIMPGDGDSTVNQNTESPSTSRRNIPTIVNDNVDSHFVGDPVPHDEAVQRWPHRYVIKPMVQKIVRGKNVKSSEDDDVPIPAKRHYLSAVVDCNIPFELYDHAHVKSEGDAPPYICKIIELFEGLDGQPYFRAQWYYRPNDTVIETSFSFREKKRIFKSEVQDDNPLDCLLEKVTVVRVNPNLDVVAKQSAVPECDYYYDMAYLLPYSTFVVPVADAGVGGDSKSSISSEADDIKTDNDEADQARAKSSDMTLLDLYCGCGAMSTGLCLGAKLCGVNLQTKWAIDLNNYACESVRLNHPETRVRNESVEDFLMLLKEWKRLCASYSLIDSDDTHDVVDAMGAENDDSAEDAESNKDETSNDEELFEVEHVIGICYGNPKGNNNYGLHFKVSWKGYGPDYDTWEPVDGLGNCRESIGEFVKKGYKERALPLPGDVDVVCGGPPCQGLSGFNRFRNKANPLADPKNKQLIVFMDVIDYLRPKHLLMENVVDLVKFSKGFCGRYAMGRLVDMNYQARMGLMAAGAYGLPQFRMRVFLWGARPSERLAQYPLPTHDVLLRGVTPREFERNTVAFNEGDNNHLEEKLYLGDAISDLPDVDNYETRDDMPYGDEPRTEFQRFIRLTKDAVAGSGIDLLSNLYDHCPLKLNVDDYGRVCMIPKEKGANFRDLPGVRVKADNTVELDPNVERAMLPSGKPVVPDYALTFVGGTSTKPFGRLWYDETVPTVVTRAEPHNQAILHPHQDRVLTIRENARLQGFPDYYQLIGPIKERYIQVGNAVAVPVARALGYSLALACQGNVDDNPLLTLPSGFPLIRPDGADSVEVEDHS